MHVMVLRVFKSFYLKIYSKIVQLQNWIASFVCFFFLFANVINSKHARKSGLDEAADSWKYYIWDLAQKVCLAKLLSHNSTGDDTLMWKRISKFQEKLPE